MNWKYKIFFSLVFLCCFNGIYAQPIQKLRIDPAQSYGGDISDYFESYEYIPLETTKQSIFGEIVNLIITKSSIVITDHDSRATLFFTKDGKFITKIKEKDGVLPTIYTSDNDSLIIIYTYHSATGNEGLKYADLYGNLIKTTKKVVQNKSIALGDGYTAQFVDCDYLKNDKDNKKQGLINIYYNNQIYNSFFPLPANDYGFCKLAKRIKRPLRVEKGSFYISTPFDYWVYKVTKDTAIKMFKFTFPENRTYPTSKILNYPEKEFIDSLDKTRIKDWQKIMDINNLFYIKNYLFFRINPRMFLWFKGADEFAQYNFIYDTVSNKLISLGRLSPDAKTSYLPILGSEGHRLNLYGLYTSGDLLYFDVSALEMFTAYEKNKNRKPQYPPVLQQYFKTQNRKSNPVIVRMKLKE